MTHKSISRRVFLHAAGAVSLGASSSLASLVADTPPFRLPFPAEVKLVAWSPDGTGLLAVDESGTVRVVSSTDGNVQATLPDHDGLVRSISWSTGEVAATADHRHVYLWDPRSWKRLAKRFAPGGVASISPNGAHLATAYGNDMALWRPDDESPRRVMVKSSGAPAWSPDSLRLGLRQIRQGSETDFDMTVGIYEAETGNSVGIVDPHWTLAAF